MKPYCIHYSNRKKAMELLPKDSVILRDQYSWMIVRIPNMDWHQVRKHFGDEALVGVCEQKEYLTDEEKAEQPEEWKVDRSLPEPPGCGKLRCSV